jgi:uncharacterized protein YndB with AHSA1/START domain
MCGMEFREGGTTLVCMRSAEGTELYNTWTYRSIEPMSRIEFVQGLADEKATESPRPILGFPRRSATRCLMSRPPGDR